MSSESKGGGRGSGGAGGAGGTGESKASSDDGAFCDWMLGSICEHASERMMFSRSLSDLTADLTDTLPPTHRLNIYRKQFGNLKQAFADGRFSDIVRLDGNIVKPIVPFPAREGPVSRLVGAETHARVLETIASLQQQKQKRGVTKWEVVN